MHYALVQCVAGAATVSTVRITTQHAVAFGEGIKAVGSGPPLGDWDPAAAPGEGLHARQHGGTVVRGYPRMPQARAKLAQKPTV